MSAMHGDKSRYGRLRKQKIRSREKLREFRKTRTTTPAAPSEVPAPANAPV